MPLVADAASGAGLPPGVAPCAALQPAMAVLKSGQILLSGTGVWVVAVQGAWSTTLDEALAAHRLRQSCRSLPSLLAAERDLARRTQATALVRMLLLLRIALQLCDEGADPPQRCVDWALDLLQDAVRA